MDIRPQEIEYTKNIGTLDGNPVIEVATIGGYHLICRMRGPKIDYLGAGPHRAVARWIAQKRNSGLKITELSKSDWRDPVTFMNLVPRYERMTDRMNQLAK